MAHVKYFWDEIEDNIIEEYDGDTGNTIVEYTTEPTLYGQVLSQDRGGQIRHYHYDGQGNTTELTDENGNVTDSRKYSAFGEVTASSGTTEFPYQWGATSGYYYETTTAFPQLIRRRPYGPGSGRWLSYDPIGREAGDNLFEYADSNPTNLVDPSGLAPIRCRCSCGHPHYVKHIWVTVNCNGRANTCCKSKCLGTKISQSSHGCWWNAGDPWEVGPYNVHKIDFYICRALVQPGPTLTDKCGQACGAKHCSIGMGLPGGDVIMIRQGAGGMQDSCLQPKSNHCKLHFNVSGTMTLLGKKIPCSNAKDAEIALCIVWARKERYKFGLLYPFQHNCQRDTHRIITGCCLNDAGCFLPAASCDLTEWLGGEQ